MRPLVGITSYAQVATFGHWTLPAALLPLSYVRSVESAGGRALVVPPAGDAVEETLDALDALVLSGGADLDPSLYAAEPHPETRGAQAERDRAELALLEEALERELPLLAICRGMQLLNVLHRGGLHQHLPELVGHERHREMPGVFSEHAVRVQDGSLLAGIVGPRLTVKSHHHQGIDRVGEGLAAVAWADDGSVEAIEAPGRAFALGVLWHPEEERDPRLFAALVERARGYRSLRRPPGGRPGSRPRRP